MAIVPENRTIHKDESNVIRTVLPKEHHGGKLYIKTHYTPLESLIVKRSGNNISLILRIEYARGTFRSDKDYFKTAVKQSWDGSFGEYHVTVTIGEKVNPNSNLIRFVGNEQVHAHCTRRDGGGGGWEMYIPPN